MSTGMVRNRSWLIGKSFRSTYGIPSRAAVRCASASSAALPGPPSGSGSRLAAPSFCAMVVLSAARLRVAAQQRQVNGQHHHGDDEPHEDEHQGLEKSHDRLEV